MAITHQLAPQLKQLRLSGILDTLDVRQQQAVAGQWSYAEFLERLLQDEVERRAQKQLDLRVRRAGLNTQKTLDTFDFSFNPAINRQQILQLAASDYIRRHHNILLCGPSGVGKSHLAAGLAHSACQQGFNVLVVNAHKLLQHLNGGRADNTFDRRLRPTCARTCWSSTILASSRWRRPRRKTSTTSSPSATSRAASCSRPIAPRPSGPTCLATPCWRAQAWIASSITPRC